MSLKFWELCSSPPPDKAFVITLKWIYKVNLCKFLGTVKFGNDQVAKIMGYGDYQIGNVTISRVYYIEGLGHNLFSVGYSDDIQSRRGFSQEVSKKPHKPKTEDTIKKNSIWYIGSVWDQCVSRVVNGKNRYSRIVDDYLLSIYIGVRLSTSASGSQPSGNTRNDRIQQTPSSNSKNKVEAHPRNVKSSLNKRNGTVKVNGSASVQNSKKHDNSDYVCINGDDCMSSDNLCVVNSMNDVKFRAKSKKEIWKPTGKVFNKMGYIWRPTGRTFTIVGNACPLTRITTTNEVPSRKPIVLDSESPKPVVKLVYSRKPRKNKNTESVSKTKVVQIVLWYLDSGCSKHMTRDRSQLTNFISKFLGTVKFGNDQVAKIMGYGDYQIGNVTILRVYYVEGLGHNLFSVGQFCDSNLEVAFR
ncbi:hypothetical protein Tco_0952136 [Tanacetum coccineum]|uniref:Retrovirus-related Pol polyprotein from transposon TNT 1-94-like beta-barrel domain-containing protein n=1 Tax=Tanacetum coccineum TaxID=301880 RepID=A0ABQ5DW21_9ASTR